jgi:hypothetical protein
MNASKAPASRWLAALPDAAGFAAGLALAWYFRWATTDLVWSLWLSSLVVGYATIVWSLAAPVIGLVREGSTGDAVGRAVGGLFLLAFFTVHFGMFHLVHSLFLNALFPVGPKAPGLASLALYAEVVQRYWWFVPLAALSERESFRLPALPPAPPKGAVTAEAIAARKARGAAMGGGAMMSPYKNVVRLHLLIFFFVGAHFAKLDSFLVYAVVYAVYFFPWRLLFGGKAEPTD